MNKPIVTHTTHPAQEQTKRVCPRRADETPDARHKRLKTQKAANRVRVRPLGQHTWEVPSQRRGPDNKPVCTYLVREYEGLGFTCTCPWSAGKDGFAGHGLYTPGENDRAQCAHMTAVLEYIKRQDREVARVTKVIIARMEAQEAA